MTELTRTGARKVGLKARIEKLLAERPAEALSLAQIGAALDLPKTEHGAISATLVKIHCAGGIRISTGPSGSAKGRRNVKLYRHNPRSQAPGPVPVAEMHGGLALAFTR